MDHGGRRRAPGDPGADGPTRPDQRLCCVASARQRGQPAGSHGLVLADAEFDSERTHQHIRQLLQANSIIPAKRGGATWRLQGLRAQMRQEFPAALYRRRALIESLMSVVARQLSARVPGRSFQTQCLQALLLDIAYNIYRLWLIAFLGT
jgi:hypothetical protein